MSRSILLFITVLGCDMSADPDPVTTDPATTDPATTEPADYAATVLGAGWSADLSASLDGTTLSLQDGGLPNHDVLEVYAVPGGSTLTMDDTITGTDYTVELAPVLADEPTETSLGTIGIAVSGGWFFNPYEGDGTTVALDSNFEVDGVPFLDSCNGHPLPTDRQYHYHGNPHCVTDLIDTPGQHSSLLGVLNDGFPVYGLNDIGGAPPSDLNECSGHTGATPEFPDGVFHYHMVATAPYIMTCYSGVVEDDGPGGGPPGGGPPP